MRSKLKDTIQLNQLDEALDYCHAIRGGIIWIAETIIFSKQYVGWKIPLEAIGKDSKIDWKAFEKKAPKEYRDYMALELFSGLNNDFLHFTNHSLKSLHPASMAVSYTLARKPYRDNLLYLEYLYARPEEFLEIFLGRHAKLKTKDLDNHLKNEKLKRALVEESCKKLKKAGSLSLAVNNPGFLYEFRYETQYTGFFDSATHLITSRASNATSDVNMNFIFLNNETENAEQHAAHLIRIHLNSLNYALELMYDLMFILMKDFFSDEDFKKFEEYFKYLLFRKITSNLAMAYGHRLLSGNSLDKGYILTVMKALKYIVKYECSACKSKRFSDTSLKSAEILIFDEAVVCKRCRYPSELEHPMRLTVE